MSRGVLYFGSYDANYSRNKIIIRGLKCHQVKVYECQANGFFVQRFYKLIVEFLKLQSSFETIIVGFPGWFDLPLAFIVGKLFNKRVIFDVFTPMYETYFLDRRQVKVGFIYLLMDKLNMKLADFVLCDTKSHADIYIKDYGLKLRKVIVVYVGSDDQIFFPRKFEEETDVLFYGSYQPLQGTEFIIKAAEKLPNVKFKLIGKGQMRKSTEELTKNLKIKNVEFAAWVKIEQLAIEINKAKIILGIFGKSKKAMSVIPNKVYDALACSRIVITSLTPASAELLSNLCYLTKTENDFVRAVNELMRSKRKRDEMASRGYNFYKKYLRPKEIVKPILDIL